MNKILIATIILTLLLHPFVLAPLFNYIDQLLANLIGYKLGDNIYIIIIIQSIIFGILLYAILSSFKDGEPDGEPDDKPNEEPDDEPDEPNGKPDDEPDDKLEAFDVGGSLTCK